MGRNRLEIRKDLRIRDVQEAFQQLFPFLRLEFYSEPHELQEGSPEESLLSPELKLDELKMLTNEGVVEIDETKTTGAFEAQMREAFGLNVQVFRKSYGRWLQTWATDVWSLKEQNRRGMIMGELSD